LRDSNKNHKRKEGKMTLRDKFNFYFKNDSDILKIINKIPRGMSINDAVKKAHITDLEGCMIALYFCCRRSV
jgi:hypothetical protein